MVTAVTVTKYISSLYCQRKHIPHTDSQTLTVLAKALTVFSYAAIVWQAFEHRLEGNEVLINPKSLKKVVNRHRQTTTLN